MTRMTSDIEALTQLLQTGLVNALVSLITCARRRHRAARHELATRPAGHARRAAAGHRHDLVPAAVRRGLRRGPRPGRRRQRRLPGEPVGRARRPGLRARGPQQPSGSPASRAPTSQARLRAQRLVATYFPFVEMLSEIAAAIVLAGGAALIDDGSLTSGQLIAFLLYLDLFFSPIQQLSQVFDTYQQARVALDRIGDLLATPTSTPEAADPVVPGRLAGRVTFEDVALRLPDDRRRGAPRRRPDDRAGRDRRHRRRDRRRQVDAREAGRPLLRRHRRPGAASTASTCATSTWPPTATSSASCPRRRSCSPAPSATTSPTAGPTPPTPRSRPRPGPSAPTTSSPGCPAATCT